MDKTRVNKSASDATWAPVESMVRVAQAESEAAKKELCRLLDTSDRMLAPLCDPLRVDLGLHRWLSEEREEAYSDWLNWVLQQLEADEIQKVLGISDSKFAQHCRIKPKCSREFVIPRGRLDIIIRFGSDAMIVIEVKKTSAEDANTAKQEGYTKWINSQGIRLTKSVLLVIDASDEYYHGFETQRWEDFCIALRRMLPAVHIRRGIMTAAMCAAFVGAIEQNLLGLVPPEDGRSLRYSRTADHIERSLS